MPEVSFVIGSSSSKPFMNKIISIHLDELNCLLRRQQILFAVESLALVSHIDGIVVIPSQYVVVNGSRVGNSEFVSYKQHNNALCSWMLASILPSLVNCRTSLKI
ncbi:hypothetical protein GQ457_02G011780 [Hibiscus cannabinus]